MQTSAREHNGHIFTKKLDVGESLAIAGTPITATAADINTLAGAAAEGAQTKLQGGTLAVTGTGTVTVTLATLTSAVASLQTAESINGDTVSVAWTGLVITFSVWKPTSTTNPTPIASTTATTVNWMALGT